MAIQVKSKKELMGLLIRQYHGKLVDILMWLLDHVDDIVITESWRPKKHPNDLHGTRPVRAVDLRSWIYPEPGRIALLINEAWEYDPERPGKHCCVYHAGSSGTLHFHIQVHPNTQFKKSWKDC